MVEPIVTLVVVPRERFSCTEHSLESLYEHTKVPFKLIYIDGNSPSRIKHYLKVQAKQKEFLLIRTEHFLSPNQARNLGLSKVNTKYVVFFDNDVLFTPNWLNHLLECAEETGAGIVGPLYLEGKIKDQIIHMAGGSAHFKHFKEDNQDGQRLFEEHCFAKQELEKVRSQLQRKPTELIEFHCTLVRTEVFQQLGPLDEKLMSMAEHIDLCLTAREHNYAVYFEPNAIVSYIAPPPFVLSDLSYYFLRWSDKWNQVTMNRFREKWNLAENDTFILGQYNYQTERLQMAFVPLIRQLLQVEPGSWIDKKILQNMEKQLKKLLHRRLIYKWKLRRLVCKVKSSFQNLQDTKDSPA